MKNERFWLLRYVLRFLDTKISLLLWWFFSLFARDYVLGTEQSPCLVLAPHPDDESLGCGGAVARLRRAGAEVHIVVVTDGRHSTQSQNLSPEELVLLRQDEAREACKTLDISLEHLSFLDFRDGETTAQRDALREALKKKIRAIKPRLIVGPLLTDLHPDHQAVAAAVLDLQHDGTVTCPVLAYPLWFWPFVALRSLLKPWSLGALRRVDVRETLAHKREAMHKHRSQCENLTGEHGWRFLRPGLLEKYFTPFELFFEQTVKDSYPAHLLPAEHDPVKLPDSRPIINVALRMVTLVTKVILMLYMGRYLSLSDMGTYGLVFGAVAIAGDVLGLRFDYVISRELVGASPAAALCKMRDQTVLYGLIYAALVILGFAFHVAGGGAIIPEKILVSILALAIVESLANAVHVNVISLGRPLIANVLFFIRAALWVIVAIALGFLHTSFQNVETIFVCWFLGVVLSLGGTLYLWRHMPWGFLWKTPIHWAWIVQGVKRTAPIWIGTIGATMGAYVDRFVVVHYLGLDAGGVLTFYSSFVAAVQTLIFSGVLSFAFPHLISLHQEQGADEAPFWQEMRKTIRNASLWAIAIAICMAIGVPALGWLSQKEALIEEEFTLLLLLVGAFIRANADAVYYGLFARHQDKQIWLGNLLFLIPAIAFNLILVPILGFSGIGWGYILTNLFLLLWRWHHLHYPGGLTGFLWGKR